MNELIKLNKVNGSNVIESKELYDRIENNIRALKTVGIQQEHFGSFLIPIILEKIPNIIRLQISRQLRKENWNIDEFLQCINQEITARESYEFLKMEKVKRKTVFQTVHYIVLENYHVQENVYSVTRLTIIAINVR